VLRPSATPLGMNNVIVNVWLPLVSVGSCFSDSGIDASSAPGAKASDPALWMLTSFVVAVSSNATM
jgi:hypothetical protein